MIGKGGPKGPPFSLGREDVGLLYALLGVLLPQQFQHILLALIGLG